MEVGSEGEKKQPPEGETKSKRKMKTASQLEVLEKTYAVDSYPSEAVRADLSAQLGLSDRQLQMWFCHRRLKDRKGPPAKRQRKDPPSSVQLTVGDELAGNDLSPFLRGVQGSGTDVAAMKRCYEMPPPPPSQQSVVELRAIAFVEAQLGEPLREDGPILGMEFDPLPPGAFGAPIGPSVGVPDNQPGRPFETKQYERPDMKLIKVASRPLHEYQFLPEQPTVRDDAYKRAATSHQYSSPGDGLNPRTASLSIGHPLMHVNEQVSPGYGFPGQLPNLNLLSHQSRQSHLLPSASGEHENVTRKNSISTATGAHFVAQPVALENHFVSSERRVTHDEDVLRVEKKRKSEEARIAREIEAHEKRIRKELEKQDMLRRKREEQIRKEMERQERERRKEEERLLREKQREEERYLREQRRELERREKYLHKESIRAEKLRQKEELRREKEAARIKAANERAIARRAAKESMELLDDERLELMELAASRKGLPTMMSLDYETFQNLDSFRDMLCSFPPKSVQLKKPFAVQPWNGSEENVGNLLMVWRFLITFADILGLWPFTLDELVQAFHDYDPRLLGEIHIALLRSIIKDIEDAAKTPFSGSGTNQSSVTNPGGGHPQIVEGAYAWGFDICSWQQHLNVLTWPEILRQFALSAGFGPQLKKRNVDQAHLRDDNEGDDGKDIISNLRNGAAAENAVAKMQERGFSNGRRSRHLLTPGTVKFAAFHVLSLEGSKGLTILEVADKIQKSGLRDLTTSKTPEASIAAALSRDTKLFERVAPSTYSVRPAYRKDPSDAEAILSAARERIRVYKSGSVDVEEADEVERDEGRDRDSESDEGEDAEADALGTELNAKEADHSSNNLNGFNANIINGNENNKDMGSLHIGLVDGGLSSLNLEGRREVEGTGALMSKASSAAQICNGESASNHADTDIDESSPGESWVEGLTNGEYSDLTVEERLNALVALIGLAIEGNSIRVVLEERLEAANALKKQMWAEAQLDKRRTKEDYVWRMHYPSCSGSKTDPNISIPSVEGRTNQSGTFYDKNNISLDLNVQQERVTDRQDEQNCLSSMPADGNPQMQDYPISSDNLPYHQQPTFIAEKSRSQLKSFIGHKAEEMYVYRSLPLGQDRRRNRYWRFVTSASRRDPGCGRIFIELLDSRWRVIDSEEAFDALLASLDVRGVRESHLHSMLLRIEMSFKETVRKTKLHDKAERESQEAAKAEAIEMVPCPNHIIGTDYPCSVVCKSDSDTTETSTSFAIELGRNEAEKGVALKRYQDFEKWMWRECNSSSILCAVQYGKKRCKQLLGTCDCCYDVYIFEDYHCQSCHKTFVTAHDPSFSEHAAQCNKKLKESVSSPLRLRLLKVQLAVIEASVPSEALNHVWTDDIRKSWGMKLHLSVSAEDLVQILTQLENAIRRDYLSSNFETTSELLHLSNLSAYAANYSASPQTVSVLPWVPQTTAAVALRLMELDDAISYTLHQKGEPQRRGIIKLPSRFTVARIDESPHRANHSQEANWVNVEIGPAGSKHKQGINGRGRGRTPTSGRSQKRVVGSRSVKGSKTTNANSDLLVWKGRTRGKKGHKRGRRSNRSRRKSTNKVVGTPKESVFEKPSELVRDDEATEFPVEGAENASTGSERSEYHDEISHTIRDEYDDLDGLDEYGGAFNGRSEELQAASEEDNMDGDEEYEEEGEEQEGDFNIEGYVNEDTDEEGMGDGDPPGGNRDLDGGTGSTSFDYSD